MDWQRLFRPSFWQQLYPTSDVWDEALNDALDKHPITDVGAHTCRIGNLIVWIANYPYAYGRLRNPEIGVLPRVKTRIRLREMVLKAAIDSAGSD